MLWHGSWYINVPFPKHRSFISKIDISQKQELHLAMPLSNGLSGPQEAVLFAIWKLRGIGNNGVSEEQLKTEMTNTPAENLPTTLSELQTLGFLEINDGVSGKGISMTPLGLAILRKVEEDRLEEI
jgi:predicted transcriptional regulator